MLHWNYICALIVVTGLRFVASIPTDADYSEEEPPYCLKDIVKSDARISSHGYAAETHEVETSDGYVLTLYRIPYSHKLQNQYEHRPVVLLQHGFFSNSDCFLSNGPNDALAYLLVDAGYDVWLGNARGNIYSRKNSQISINSHKFWHFDWHEIGTIDIAAMIDYILTLTGQQSLHYAGHSQGTTVYFVLLSERPEYNAKIKSGHMLSPCAFLEKGTYPVFKIMGPLLGAPDSIWHQLFVDSEFVPHNSFINRLADHSCGKDTPYNSFCRTLFILFADGGYVNINMTALQTLVETHPAGASSNQVLHFLQLWQSGKFRQYDWGKSKNLKLYGQDEPPDYDLSKITAPTHFYSAQLDAMCVPDDVDTLVAHMPQLTEDYRIPEPTFNHLDFISAWNLKPLVNDIVIDRINSYESQQAHGV